MSNIVSHLESFLGNIEYAWKDSNGSAWPFYVLRFSGGPIANTITYSTLGLSDIPMPSAVSGIKIRHELIFLARPSFCDGQMPAILYRVGMEAISKQRPYLRGDVIGPRGTLFPSTQMAGLYFSLSAYNFPNRLQPYQASRDSSCIFAWLVPITVEEAQIIRSKGWEYFENQLSVIDPALLNFYRAQAGTDGALFNGYRLAKIF